MLMLPRMEAVRYRTRSCLGRITRHILVPPMILRHQLSGFKHQDGFQRLDVLPGYLIVLNDFSSVARYSNCIKFIGKAFAENIMLMHS